MYVNHVATNMTQLYETRITESHRAQPLKIFRMTGYVQSVD